MTTGTTRSHKPRGFTRLLFRFPIWLYRLRLGWLLGDRFVMFRHTGRKTGLPRYAVVEVVRHDHATDTYFIASGWGERSDWFQNIQKTPQVLVHAGRRQFEAMATRLSIEQATQELVDYARRHATSFRNLSKMMIGRQLEASEADCRLLAQSVPLVALVPGRSESPAHSQNTTTN
jgi:deazaflavin-dependent oxidoreductase (nitroreductase family)